MTTKAKTTKAKTTKTKTAKTQAQLEYTEDRIHFLRERLFSLHAFISKSIVTLAAASFAFMPLIFHYLQLPKDDTETKALYISAGVILFITILSQALVMYNSLAYYSKSYKNISVLNKDEHDDHTLYSERWISVWQFISAVCLFAGVGVICRLIYINI